MTEGETGLNWILLVWMYVSLVFFVAVLVWELVRYRRTSHNLKMLWEKVKRNRRVHSGESDDRNTSVDGGSLHGC